MSSQPWLDGLWYYEGSPNIINDVKGEEALWRNLAELDYPDYKSTSNVGVWTHGKFQETMKEIEEMTGATNYNVEMKFFEGAITQYGVLSEDGTSIVTCNMLNHMDTIRWLTPEKKQEVLDARVHEDTLVPPGFTPQPDNQGKILFLSGPPGAGKSTTAQFLAKEKGWVYYEADCYGGVVDPFIPLDVDEPSLAQMKQKPISGRSVDCLKSMDDGLPEFQKMIKLAPYDDEKIKPFYRHLAENIVKHKQRLGGNFAVAQAVPKREMRDYMKEVFGPQGIFVCLRLSKETNAKRIEARHAGGDPEMMKNMTDWLNNIYDSYEDAQPGEENCITVEVGPDDSREDVMKKILKKVEELEETMTEPKQRWEDGLWYFENSPSFINSVKGGEARWKNLTELDYPDFELSPYVGSWTYGKYHETLKEIEEKTGAKHYDLEMKHFDGAFTFYGVLAEDGKSVVMCNMLNEMDIIRLMTPEKMKELLALRPHQDSLIPPGCTPQPDNQGKILFLSGPPGAGKSTTAQFLAKEKGFVYYEADCFPSVVDPFIPLDVPEPSMAQLKQLPIKGRTLEDLQCLKETMPEFQKMIKLAPYDVEKTLPMFRSMAKDVVRHKERLGGNFAIAQAVAKRAQRECMKEIFGPQGIFVLLKLSKETNAKRIEGRHAGGDPEVMKSMITFLNGLYDTYEDTQPGEENCITVNIGPDDSREDVMNKILKQVDELETSKSKSKSEEESKGSFNMSNNNIPEIELIIKASTIDGRRKGACIFCQEYFMDLYLLAELKTISLKITTVDMKRPPADFRSNFEAAQPPILIDNGIAVLENEKIERHIMKAIPGGHNLFVADVEVAKRIENLYNKFKLMLVKRDDASKKAVRTLLQRINDTLAAKSTRFLTGETLCCFDCELMPKLQHIRVAGKFFVGFEIPPEMTHLWNYIREMYKLDAFTQSCPADQDIIHMYKMQQQLGSFAKMKSREELEVPSYTTTVPT